MSPTMTNNHRECKWCNDWYHLYDCTCCKTTPKTCRRCHFYASKNHINDRTKLDADESLLNEYMGTDD